MIWADLILGSFWDPFGMILGSCWDDFGSLEVGWGVAGRIWGWIGGRGMGRGREEQGMGRWKV